MSVIARWASAWILTYSYFIYLQILTYIYMYLHILTHTLTLTLCKSVEGNVRQQRRSATRPPEITLRIVMKRKHQPFHMCKDWRWWKWSFLLAIKKRQKRCLLRSFAGFLWRLSTELNRWPGWWREVFIFMLGDLFFFYDPTNLDLKSSETTQGCRQRFSSLDSWSRTRIQA